MKLNEVYNKGKLNQCIRVHTRGEPSLTVVPHNAADDDDDTVKLC